MSSSGSSVLPRLLRLPGLRRYGALMLRERERIEVLREKIAQSQTQIAGLRATIAGLRDSIAHVQAKYQESQSRQLAPDTLRRMVSQRHTALMSQRIHGDAIARESDFLTRSTSYAEAVRRVPDTPPFPVQHASVEGLVFCLPADPSSSDGLTNRILRDNWLPFDKILATREIATGAVMLDIGANVGTTSIPRVVLGDFQCVYAAEPDPANYSYLVGSVVANRLRGRVLPDCVAIGASDGDATLLAGNGIGVHRLASLDASTRGLRVPCLTLDSWVAQLGIDPCVVSFVKVDTQGWESHVLRGATMLLAHRHIAWQLEFCPRLLSRAGTSDTEMFDQIEQHFTHFIDLRAPALPRSKPVSLLREALAYVDRGFTDLLLYNAA